jgi:hypothetical protein
MIGTRCPPSWPLNPRRRGAVLLVAMVCFGVAAVAFTSLVRLAAAEQGALEAETWRLQAAWLAESGLERAAARLDADPGYQGETWRIPAESLGARDAAVVKIEVEALPERPQQRLARVRAVYPDHPHRRAQESKQMVIALPPPS